MNLRDALAWAVDFIRSSPNEDVEARRCAKVLEEKLSRMRARDLRGMAMIPARCFCGQVREERARVCPDCYRVVPMALLAACQFSKPRARKKALNSLRIICETRAQREEAQEAA
jgi:hypothetical protein